MKIKLGHKKNITKIKIILYLPNNSFKRILSDLSKENDKN